MDVRNLGYQHRNVALSMKESEDRSGTGSKLFLLSLATIEDSYRLEFSLDQPQNGSSSLVKVLSVRSSWPQRWQLLNLNDAQTWFAKTGRHSEIFGLGVALEEVRKRVWLFVILRDKGSLRGGRSG